MSNDEEEAQLWPGSGFVAIPDSLHGDSYDGHKSGPNAAIALETPLRDSG
ncbi:MULTISPECIES: hypothetical protein [Streptomyces]|uniref:Uncharacterized protein n=1 Tax=Streptomyces achmelvichensis TaxID=3134111 RepID=A0ACC6PLT6_9ACTN|nr:hypothetical protein [Streptomyces sp. NBC_00306]